LASSFSGSVWLLVDENNFSAADGFAHFAKYSEFATVVGRRTGGIGVGLQSYVMILPNTGAAIYYEAHIAFNSDGTTNGIIGTMPNIEIQQGQNALEVVLEMIQGNN